MTSSEDRSERNRRNSARSTGPKTASGKIVARLNALKFGVTAKMLLLPGESANDLRALEDGLRQSLQPIGMAEQILVDRITIAEVRRRRVEAAERSLMFAELADRGVHRARRAAGQMELQQGAVRELLGDVAATEEERGLDSYRARIEEENELAAVRDSRDADLGVVYVNAAELLDRLARHRIAAERSIDRALHELQRLQDRRTEEPVRPAITVDVTVDGEEAEV